MSRQAWLLLLQLDPTYPAQETFHVSQHTVERVEETLSTHGVELPDVATLPKVLPSGVENAFDLFVGYLLLDAMIGNTDRHHENWGVLARRDGSGCRTLQLAPTYDHASSLGRERLDQKRAARLQGERERGSLYPDATVSRELGDVPLDPSAMAMS